MVANGGGPDPVSHTNFFEKFTLHLYKGKTSNLSSCVQGFWKNLRSPRNERWNSRVTYISLGQSRLTLDHGFTKKRSSFCKIHASHTYFGLNHASSVNPLAPSFSKSVWQLSYDTAIKYRNIKYDLKFCVTARVQSSSPKQFKQENLLSPSWPFQHG